MLQYVRREVLRMRLRVRNTTHFSDSDFGTGGFNVHAIFVVRATIAVVGHGEEGARGGTWADGTN